MARVVGRQAVVLIHGIGDQIPMDTVRSFVAGVSGGEVVMGKRHRYSGIHELRRFTLKRKRRARPPTDFYELYWSHHLAKRRARESLLWALRLVFFRRSRDFEAGIRWIVRLTKSLALLGVLISLAVVALTVMFASPAQVVLATSTLLVLTALSSTLIAGFFRKPLADAARYLTPRSENVVGRAAVRNEGLELLRSLHESGEYMRIVVVGHSLGSVIGYDVLRMLWDEYRHPSPSSDTPIMQSELRGIDRAGSLVSPNRGNKDDYQQAQHRVWRENRAIGVRWLVTDFVTLGSPLTHGHVLLSSGLASLAQRQREREFPTCPPVVDDERSSSYDQVYKLKDGSRRQLRVGNEAALFSCTRWTNLYYPVRGRVLGDLVGGPLSHIFGEGILDLPVRSGSDSRTWQNFFPFPHSNYWAIKSTETSGSRADRRRENRELGTTVIDIALKEALGLDVARSKHDYPEPPLVNQERADLVIRLGQDRTVLRKF